MSWKPHILARIEDAWKSRAEPENMRVVAAVFWQILVLLCIVAVIFIIVLAVQELDAVVQAQNPPSVPSAGGGSSLDRTALDATLTQFSNREAAYRAIASSSPTIIPDPSK